MDHAFGSGEPFTVGVEEEVFLVDRESRRPVALAAEVLDRLELPPGAAAHEAYAAEIELRSPPSRSAAAAVAALESGRAAAGVAARAAGAELLAAGLHPAAGPEDSRLVELDRYRRVHQEMRGLIQRTPECALHVHVGMPDPEAAIAVFNDLRARLPLLVGLAASSPFWFGRDSGLASARWAVVRPYPGRGVPRALRDLDDYERLLEQIARGGGPGDYTLVWWDVRLHPRLGTVEVRELDAQPRLADAAALAALVQGLARAAVEDPRPAAPAEAIEWSAFRAARDGVAAEIAADAGGLSPLRDVARSSVARAREHLDPLAAEPLDAVDRILADGGSAARQRSGHCRGGMPALLALLSEETASAP